MSDREAMRRSRRARVLGAAVATAVAAACAGENLFTGPVTGGQNLRPTVEITVPQAGASVGVGDSITVTATIESGQDLSTATFSGTYSGGVAAFTSRTATFLGSVQDTTITYRLGSASANTGAVAIVVQAEDLTGQTGADTVSVTITP